MLLKIKDGFLLRNIADQHIIIPVGTRMSDLHGMIVLNETGAFLWKLLQNNVTPSELTESLFEEYQVTYEDASNAVMEFINLLISEDLLEVGSIEY